MIDSILPYLIVFASTLALTLLLTPLVRETNRRIGMVDKPDPRRINKVPVPRGGGIAIVLGVLIPYVTMHLLTDEPLLQGVSDMTAHRLIILSVGIAVWGLIDDRYSLPPKLKLLGQVVAAFLVWSWADLGFNDIWPALPMWLDALLTVLWIVGAVNAFNLIDGLDGLASGLALIAVVGMAGALFFVGRPSATLVYFAVAGGIIGFLRYNYNPASVFLGDSGSMFLGFVVSTLPLTAHDPHSILVSVGVPLLSMGVPIFDTALAILRRFLRRMVAKHIGRTGGADGKVMSADSDHLHHRILRATGLNQRKTAWILYLIALGMVATGLVAMYLQSQSAGLWLAAVAVAAVVIFKDAKIEIFEAGRLLSGLARTPNRAQRRYFATLSTPMFVVADILCLVATFFICVWALDVRVDVHTLRFELPVNVVSVFLFLVLFRAYRVSWSRATGSNYAQVHLACVFGSVAAAVMMYYWPSRISGNLRLVPMAIAYSALSFVALQFLRHLRELVRDVFYRIDCARIDNQSGVSRVLVYGTGLRYRAFRREMVRRTGSNRRIIVGLLDDDIYLRGKYIGGVRVLGTISDAPELISGLGVGEVVIGCEISEQWLGVVRQLLEPTGVKVTRFVIDEQEVLPGKGGER